MALQTEAEKIQVAIFSLLEDFVEAKEEDLKAFTTFMAPYIQTAIIQHNVEMVADIEAITLLKAEQFRIEGMKTAQDAAYKVMIGAVKLLIAMVV
jgi:hypothetical protein